MTVAAYIIELAKRKHANAIILHDAKQRTEAFTDKLFAALKDTFASTTYVVPMRLEQENGKYDVAYKIQTANLEERMFIGIRTDINSAYYAQSHTQLLMYLNADIDSNLCPDIVFNAKDMCIHVYADGE